MHQPAASRLAPREHEMPTIQQTPQAPRTSRRRVAALALAIGVAAAITAGSAAAAQPVYPANLLPKYHTQTSARLACTTRTLQPVATVSAVAENRDGSLHGGFSSQTTGTAACSTIRQRVQQYVRAPYPNEASVIRNTMLFID
jgi:hypothetical protein